MATHNYLMSLGDDTFLEIIAANPSAPVPERPRWYGLDDPFVAEGLKRQPRVLTWVVNTGDMPRSKSVQISCSVRRRP